MNNNRGFKKLPVNVRKVVAAMNCVALRFPYVRSVF
jgi:preprotein translocase subunit SecB